MKSLLTVICFSLLVFSCSKKKSTFESRPNVLFITVDDMNGWGLMKDYPLTKTPNFDNLKSQAYNFPKAVCASPVCVPSRAAMFSGHYPHKTGAYYNGGEPFLNSELLKETETIPECFKRNGYETFGRGKIFHAPLSEGREEAMFDNRPIYKGGFGPFGEEDSWVGLGKFQSVKAWEGPDSDFPDVVNVDATLDFLTKDHKKPFFCYVGLWRPHTPYTAPKRFFDMYDEKDIVMPAGYKENDLNDVPFQGRELVDSLWRFGGRKDLKQAHSVFKKMIFGYLATTSFADWNVGRVLAGLDNSKYKNNTIMVVCSDNGYHMGEKERWQKGTLWELSAYSPLLIRMPNGEEIECPQTVNLIDIYPTLVELCKLNKPSHKLDGSSLSSIFENPQTSWKPSLMTYGINYSSVSDGRYRYIKYPNGEEELYDHTKDPHEWENLIGKGDYSEVIQKLAKEIPTQWTKSTGGSTEKQKGA